jgi:hypothetical protein
MNTEVVKAQMFFDDVVSDVKEDLNYAKEKVLNFANIRKCPVNICICICICI